MKSCLLISELTTLNVCVWIFHKADHLCLFVFRLLTFILPLEADLKFQFPFRHVKMSSEDPTPLIHHPKKRQHIHGVRDSHHNNPTLYSQWKYWCLKNGSVFEANLSLSVETDMSDIDTSTPALYNLSALYFSVLNVEMAFASRGRELLPLYCCLKSTSPPSLWLIDRILAARSLSLVLQYYLCSPACYQSYPGLSGAKQGMLDTSSFAGEDIPPFRWEFYWL